MVLSYRANTALRAAPNTGRPPDSMALLRNGALRRFLLDMPLNRANLSRFWVDPASLAQVIAAELEGIVPRSGRGI
jgi:hypothetical protein